MKKTRCFITFVFVLALSMTPAYAIGVVIDGQPVIYTENSGAPFIDRGNHMQVPFRQTMERLGCNVSWDAVNRIATADKNGVSVQVPIGASYIIKNGQKITNDTINVINEGRVYLPIRVVLEAFGAEVLWDGKTRTVTAISDLPETITNLINQTHYFKGAPEKLYLGKALQDASSDQGVTVKYRGAFSDGEAIYLFLDVTDAGADLYSAGSNGSDFSLDQYDFLRKTGYTDSKQYIAIAYDEATRTSSICVEYIGSLQNDNISFQINSMNGNQQIINYTYDDLDLYKMLKQTQGEFETEDRYQPTSTSFGIFDEKTGAVTSITMPDYKEESGNSITRLKKDAFSLPLADEHGVHVADITNIGWRNGWLHVQLNPENDIKWDTAFNLKSSKTGELLYSPFHISFGVKESGKDESDYFEYMFYVGELTAENLDYHITFRNAAYRAADLAGDWQIKFAVPDPLVKKLAISGPIPVKGHDLAMQRAVISPVNISLFAAAKDIPAELEPWFRGLWADDLNLKIIYRDGKTAEIPKRSGGIIGNQKGALFRITYTAENFDEIAGLEVNGVLLPVQH